MRIRSWVLALLAVMPVIVFNSCSTANNGTTSGTGFMWVATKGDQLVSSFTIDLSNGAVSSVRSSVSTGPNPSAMALTPDGKTLFVASVDDNCGTPTTLSGSGGYLYVANQFSSTVSAYSYDSIGNLTFLVDYPVAANPSALAFSREVSNTNRDNFLFVSNTGANQVSVFSACVAATLNCGGATGVLSPISGSPFPAPTGPGPILVDPTFDWVYVIGQSSFQVSHYAFAPATGALSA